MEPIIQVKNLAKCYRIAHEKERYLALRDRLAHPFKALKQFKIKKEDFWALQDINFEVMPGEVVGIIGPNGSGKSTLLKILSQITPPTKGEAIIKGRVASLLEVGTGFHPELTGRENVYLSGIILGMTKAEIKKHFDEIVEFAGVGKFLDTPVKRYSSGMLVRLGFAVAAYLEAEILIIDEVLAVGDTEFQRKSMAKMNELTKSAGKTILFVSHNLDAVENLCTHALLLRNGQIAKRGSSKEVVRDYLYGIKKEGTKSVIKAGNDNAKIINCRLIDENLESKNSFVVSDKIGIEIEFEKRGNFKIVPNFLLSLIDGTEIFQSISSQSSDLGRNKVICWLPAHFLNNRIYRLLIALVSFNPTTDHSIWELSFNVDDDLMDPLRGEYKSDMHGVMRPSLSWVKAD